MVCTGRRRTSHGQRELRFSRVARTRDVSTRRNRPEGLVISSMRSRRGQRFENSPGIHVGKTWEYGNWTGFLGDLEDSSGCHEQHAGGPKGICHLVGQYVRFPFEGTALRTQGTAWPHVHGRHRRPLARLPRPVFRSVQGSARSSPCSATGHDASSEPAQWPRPVKVQPRSSR